MFPGYLEFRKGMWLAQRRDVVPVVPSTAGLIDHLRRLPWRTCLELGTGGGALALSLADLGSVTATDISESALELAQHNCKINRLSCEFLVSDWFQGVQGQWDLIVAHPPHELDSVYDHCDHWLKQRVSPEMICGGPDGFDHVRTIVREATQYLTDQGYLAVIIDQQRSQDLELILENYTTVSSHVSGGSELWILQARRGSKFFPEGAAQNF